MINKYTLKDYIKAILSCWPAFLELLFVILIFCAILGFNYWLAGGDIKCTLAQDSATCGAILRNKNA